MDERETYDLEAVYDAEIAPLMAQIIEICERADMPFVASFCYRQDAQGEHDFCSSAHGNIPRTPMEYHRMVAILFPKK